MSSTRCSGCGKVIKDGSKAKRVSSGKVEEEGFSEKGEWGIFHDACFSDSIDSPDLALAEIKKLAKKTTVVRQPHRSVRNG